MTFWSPPGSFKSAKSVFSDSACAVAIQPRQTSATVGPNTSAFCMRLLLPGRRSRRLRRINLVEPSATPTSFPAPQAGTARTLVVRDRAVRLLPADLPDDAGPGESDGT